MAVQIDGQPATANGHPISIGDLYKTKIAAITSKGKLPKVFLVEMAASGNNSPRAEYIILGGTDQNNICAQTVAETFVAQRNANVPIILLCPSVFTSNRPALGSVKPQPVFPDGPAVPQSLTDVLQKSYPLLHELFHFCP